MLLAIILSGVAGCPPESGSSLNVERINSCRDIPGITHEEIEAIEALKYVHRSAAHIMSGRSLSTVITDTRLMVFCQFVHNAYYLSASDFLNERMNKLLFCHQNI